MKRLTAVLLLLLCVTMVASAQATKWQFVKVFPDTNVSYNTGIHGMAVDPNGRVWASAYGTMDSLLDATSSKYVKVRAIYVYNPDGTQASFSPIKTAKVGTKTDTLFNSMRGIKRDAAGNIVGAFFDTYYRFDYKTGACLGKVVPDSNQTEIAPGFTSANEMVTGPVIPGNKIKLFDDKWAPLGTVVASTIGYSRTIEISKDGNNIYWAGYSNKKVWIYKSDLGTLGTYALKDSMMEGCQVESFAWHPKNGYLYASAGTRDTVDYGAVPPAPWAPDEWYGIDVTTKTAKDSLKWNYGAYPYPAKVDLGPRPRAIDFTPSGDTCYVAGYNFNKAAMQMFRRVAASVEQVDNNLPATYTLSQNYPNPFNPTTEIQFSVPKAGMTSIRVYDMLGREVATLVNENLAPGSYKTMFNAAKLSSGTYVYTIESGSVRMAKKMMLVK